MRRSLCARRRPLRSARSVQPSRLHAASSVVLFEDLQRSWSDARYVAERDTQEREEEEEWMAERVEGGVVEVEDRPWEG